MYPTVRPPVGSADLTNSSSIRNVYTSKRVGDSNPASDITSVAPDIEESDELFLDILRKVRLADLAKRMGGGDEYVGLRTSKDWSKTLSLGEQQRLAFARILYNKPDLVVLDGKLVCALSDSV